VKKPAARDGCVWWAGLVKEQCRDESGVRWIEDLWQDLTYGARLLRRSPMFTWWRCVSLALGSERTRPFSAC